MERDDDFVARCEAYLPVLVEAYTDHWTDWYDVRSPGDVAQVAEAIDWRRLGRAEMHAGCRPLYEGPLDGGVLPLMAARPRSDYVLFVGGRSLETDIVRLAEMFASDDEALGARCVLYARPINFRTGE